MHQQGRGLSIAALWAEAVLSRRHALRRATPASQVHVQPGDRCNLSYGQHGEGNREKGGDSELHLCWLEERLDQGRTRWARFPTLATWDNATHELFEIKLERLVDVSANYRSAVYSQEEKKSGARPLSWGKSQRKWPTSKARYDLYETCWICVE